ncbi:MAG TPA: oxygenase MpaB family protein [Solirubrobacterales bacterium]|jgi:uncharacterized protein (DUF2236 family)
MSGNDGYFAPGSMLRRVHSERAVGLLYGQRALAIGAIDPRNFVGTIRNSRYTDRPFQRLATTAKMFETIFFGSRAEADRVLAAVHRMHERVRGRLEEGAGPIPAGTPYSAFDPELMLWTVAVSADSAMYFYELLVREPTEAERDEFWRDYVRFGELFGMPADVAPASWAEFRSYFDGKVWGPQSYLTEEARYVGRAVMFEIPVPPARWPAMRVHNLLMRGSLPRRVREMYRLAWTPAHEAAFRAAVAAHRATRPFTPGWILRGPNTRSFELVARTERTRIARGEPIPGALTG